jgi:glycosyl transferase family 90
MSPVEPDLRGNWQQALVARQFEPLSGHTFTRSSLDDVERCYRHFYRESFVRYCVDGGILRQSSDSNAFRTFVRERLVTVSAFLERIAPSLPDIEFLVCLLDGFTGWGPCPAPVFTFSRHITDDAAALLLPDPHTIQYGEWTGQQIDRARAINPWHTKRGKAVWRGFATGHGLTLRECAQNPRFQLVEYSMRFPDEVDARLTGFDPSCEPELPVIASKKQYVAPYASLEYQLGYKYIFMVDGFASPWQSDLWLMKSNSVIFRRESKLESWFYPLIKPGVHYVAISSDYANARDEVLKARANDEATRRIAVNANCLADTVMTDDGMTSYTACLLKRYASTFTNI